MKSEDNDGVPRELAEALRAIDRPKWMAANADSFFGVGLDGIAVSPEMKRWMSEQCLDCSPRASRGAFVASFTADVREEMRQSPC